MALMESPRGRVQISPQWRILLEQLCRIPVDFYQANCMDFGLLTGASRDVQPRSLLNTTMPREMRRQSTARRERRQATTMLFPFTTISITLEGNSFFASSYLLRSPKFTNK